MNVIVRSAGAADYDAVLALEKQVFGLHYEHRPDCFRWRDTPLERERFDAMLADGFLEEMSALRARGDLSTDLPSMRCVGYRQVWDYLAGSGTTHTLAERGIAATRQLAKRQLTWLRKLNADTVLDCSKHPDMLPETLAVCRQHFGI